MSGEGEVVRAARSSDPGYLTRVWEAANGTWSQPSENDLRAFLRLLAKEGQAGRPVANA